MNPCSHSQIEHQRFCPLRNRPPVTRPIRFFYNHIQHIKDPRKASLLSQGGAQDSLRCRHTARAAEVSDSNGPEEQFPVSTEVFPRIRESNPWRRLGLSEEASFEEVQEARNYLYDAYRHHERSREAIELAFEKILKMSLKNREKFGFQPPRTGRKTDRKGIELPPTIMERIKDAVEPDLSVAAFVNDGSVFLVLGAWAAYQVKVSDPTFPMALTLIYAVYKFFQKRKQRNPDGPHFGGSPIWAALGMTCIGFVLGGLISVVLLKLLPLPGSIPPDGFALFTTCFILGLFSLFFR